MNHNLKVYFDDDVVKNKVKERIREIAKIEWSFKLLQYDMIEVAILDIDKQVISYLIDFNKFYDSIQPILRVTDFTTTEEIVDFVYQELMEDIYQFFQTLIRSEFENFYSYVDNEVIYE